MEEKIEKKPHEEIATFYSKVQSEGYISSNEGYRRGIRDLPSIADMMMNLERGGPGNYSSLSYKYYLENGLYSRIINHYAGLLDYSYLLIPILAQKTKYSETFVQNGYYSALNFIENSNFKDLYAHWAKRVLIYGTHYGAVKTINKKEVQFIELPQSYCRSTHKDFFGNDVVEFNLSYFLSFPTENERNKILKAYPSEISEAYQRNKKNIGADTWVRIPYGTAFVFTLGDGYPPFLSTIASVKDYRKSVELELERAKEEIQKVLVQKIPHLNDGTLLFEPPEAAEMHSGTVRMLAKNPNIAVLTTYADVDVVASRSQSEASKTSALTAMARNIYQEAGVSEQLFNSTSSQALKFSIQNDIAYMMELANQFSRLTKLLINRMFEKNPQVSYDFNILPVGRLNATDYIADAFKLASSGYSLLHPAVAMGMTQRQIVSIKELENDLLELEKKFIPLSSAYTQSASSGTDRSEGGRPEKALEEKSEKTIRNKEEKKEGS